MIKKILTGIFWLTFFGFFIYFTLPKFKYFTEGIPVFMGKETLFEKTIFVLHIFSGIIVYITGVIQFTPSIRNRNISFHRKAGKLYIAASLICTTALYIMIPDGLCTACRPSHYVVTSLWLIFVLAAYYFIRHKKIEWHKRMMVSSFICAAYFVTARIIDRFAMGIFRALFSDEDNALLASDIFVWAVPLMLFHLYWVLKIKTTSSLTVPV